MATRINTKFVITLVSIIVLLVLSMLMAFMYLKKDAGDHVQLAEEALERADAAMTEGNTKAYNSELMRAAKHFGSARDKDATNVDYLYGFMDAHERVICKSLTKAGNHLESILAGASNLHDTLGASDEDRKVLYEMLHERMRMAMFNSGQNPIGAMYAFTTKRLDINAEDPVAQLYHAISLSFMAEQRTEDEEVLEDVQALDAAIQSDPENPWLASAAARYHLGNARRLSRAKGGTYTPEVNASLQLAFEYASQALNLADDNMPAFVEAAGTLTDLRSGDKDLSEKMAARKLEAAKQLDAKMQDKANRDALYMEELARAIAILRRARPTGDEADQLNGPERAYQLAETLVQDRPDMPMAYQILGSLKRDRNQFAESVKTLKAGLAVERETNAVQYVRDNGAQLQMLSQLADVTISLGLRETDLAKRESLLTEADALIDEIEKKDTLIAQWQTSRVDFLRGRNLVARSKWSQAVTELDKANQAYGSRDPETLRLLAQTHAKLGNDKLVIELYETIINNNLNPTGLDLLNLINLYLNPGESQQLERAEVLLASFRKQFPGNIAAVRLQARLLTAQDKTPEAIALLQEQDLEKNPDLRDMITGLVAQGGDTKGLIELLQERIADRPEGEKMNLPLVTQLLNLLPDNDAKKAELERLAGLGLDPKIADVFRRVLASGKPTLEDELALIAVQELEPAAEAMQKFLLYRRWNKVDEAKQFLDQAASLDATRPDVIEWQFRLALMENRWADAEKSIATMLKLPPSARSALAVADGRFMRAQLLAVRAGAAEEGEARNKQVREAIIAYNNALSEYSHYVDGWLQLGRLHFSQGNYFASQDSLLEALNRQSRNVSALELMGLSEQASGDRINALERFEQILAIQPSHPTALDRFTALAQQMGLTPRAIALREQIKSRVPGNYNNRRVLAMLYAQINEHDQAKQAIQEVIDADGKSLQNIAVLCQVLGTNKQNDQAIQAVNDYLAQLGDKVAWRDHLLLAQVYEQAEKTADADAAYAKAIAAEKPEGTFTAALSHAQMMLNRGQTAEAASLYESLTEQFPENDGLKQQAAELFLRLGQFDKAEAFAKSLPATANRSRLLIQTASSQQDKLGIAITRAQQAVKDFPSDFGLRLNLLELLRLQQDRLPEDQRSYNKLLPMAKKLTNEYPDRVDAQAAMADVLLRIGRQEQATVVLKKALEFAPRHLGLNERLLRIKLTQATQLASVNPTVSQERAREALSICTILLQSRPDLPVLLRSAGQAAELAGVTSAAVEYYRQTFEATKSARDLGAYAAALLAADQAANARAVLDARDNVTLVNENLYLRALLGRSVAESGRPDNAANYFGTLLKETTQLSEQIMVTQQVLIAFKDDPAKAIAIIEGALGQELPARIDLTLASLLMGKGDYTQADDRLTKYIANPTEDTNTQFSILTQVALARQESGRLVESKAAYDIVFAKLKKNKDLIPARQQVNLLNNMAYLLADQLGGDYAKDAVGYAKQALALMSENVSDRDYALIQDTLGWAYYKADQPEDAIRELKASTKRFPFATNLLHLGQVYLSTGEKSHKDLAQIILEDALRQAKAEGDPKMIEETQKWYDKALKEAL